jgi:XrtJ-associated TM-motif-TM protein
MKKILMFTLGIALLFFVAHPLHAQGGDVDDSGQCTDSPENPTAILAVVGSAGAFLVSTRTRIKARRNRSK